MKFAGGNRYHEQINLMLTFWMKLEQRQRNRIREKPNSRQSVLSDVKQVPTSSKLIHRRRKMRSRTLFHVI